MQLSYSAPRQVSDVIASLGRTEDIRFSPNNRRLAVAGFSKNLVIIFDVGIGSALYREEISLTHATQISSPSFKSPHGIDFIDDETIVVANRDGDAVIVKLPAKEPGEKVHEVAPLAIIRSGHDLHTPGSVSVFRTGEDSYHALICNNYSDCVTRHELQLSSACSIKSSAVLLRKWLGTPDGISVSSDRRWIAVSNHNTHSLLLYKNDPSLNEASDPDGILRGAFYPHGVRFTSDGRFILVADAGAPYVHIYGSEECDWRGVRNPLASFRIMNLDDFLRGRFNPLTGGPKGIDIDNATSVLVTSCENQPLGFFDLKAILHNASSLKLSSKGRHNFGPDDGYSHDQRALEVKSELSILEKIREAEERAQGAEERARQAELRAEYAEVQAATVAASRSWKIMASLRWALSLLSRLQGSRAARVE